MGCIYLGPVNWGLGGFLEVGVGFAERFGAEEAVVGGEGRGVRGFYNQML